MSDLKSVERRLYDAWHKGRGIRLTADELLQLLNDDAIETRITNKIAEEFGYDEPGAASRDLWGPQGSVANFISSLGG